MNKVKTINIILPIFNEESSIVELLSLIEQTLISCDENFIFTLVDDGSTDNSWEIIKQLQFNKIKARKIRLSRNFGHQSAIFCGLSKFNEDAAIILDSDFQDDPKYIPDLISEWNDGNDIVLAKRVSRKENLIRKYLVNLYFVIQNKLTDVKIPKNVGHYSLIDKKIVDLINSFPENRKFLLGLRSYVGFQVSSISVVKNSRKYDKPKMSFAKLVKLSSEGLIGFSNTPLNLIGIIGFLISLSALFFALYTLFQSLLFDNKVLNWDFGLTSIYFLSGVQLLSISVLGQYISKIFEETKSRPFFIIQEEFFN